MAITAFLAYLKLEKKYSSHTITAYQRDLDHFSIYCQQEFEVDQIEQVSYSMIRSWIVVLKKSELTHRSINRKLSSLRSYYKFLVHSRQITESPMAFHQPLKMAKKVQTPFSTDEIKALLSPEHYPDTYEGQLQFTLIAMLYYTGMRRKELIGLTINNLDSQKRTLKVLGKQNKERIIPVVSELRTHLEQYEAARESLAWADDDCYLVNEKGQKLTEKFVYDTVNFYLKGVTKKTKKSPHMLRHSFATHLLDNAADLNAVKELLGHASVAATQIYTNSSLEQLQKVYQGSHPRGTKK